MNYRRLMLEAYRTATRSTDRSTKNGAILFHPESGDILMRGCNHHVGDFEQWDKYHERPLKYKVTEHAERDVIFKAVSSGLKTSGLVMVCPYACCTDCARAIALAKIPLVVAHKQAMDRTPERWKKEIELGLQILESEGTVYYQWDGKIDGGCQNLFDGEVWTP